MKTNFKPGDRVICVTGSTDFNLIKGREYIVGDSKIGCCNKVLLTVGLFSPENTLVKCGGCFKILQSPKEEIYFRAECFALVAEKVNYVKVAVEIAEPVLS